jgi:hypothetical protein
MCDGPAGHRRITVAGAMFEHVRGSGSGASTSGDRARGLMLVAALALPSCDAPPPPDLQAPTERAASSTPAPTAPRDRPHDYATAHPKKGAVLGGEEVARAVTWPEASTVDAPLRDRMAPASREKLAGAALPVLVPALGIEAGHLTVGDGWYAFSATHDGATINVQGSARARVYPGIGHADPPHLVRGRGAFISQNEGIWVVSWIEHGASYSVELECADPRGPACRGPDRAVEIAQTLAFVGGRGEKGGPQ